MRSASALLQVSALLVGSGGGVARADTTVPVNLEVSAAVGCTSLQDLAARITTRQARVRFNADATALTVRARFSSASNGKTVAELTLLQPDSKPTQRQIVANSCVQAAEAVALIVAISVDPSSVIETRGDAENPTERPAPGPRSESLVGSGGAADAAPTLAPAPELSVQDWVIEPSSTSESPDARDGGTLRWGVQLAGHALFGTAPGATPGATLYGMVGVDRRSLFSPAVTLGVTHAWKSNVERSGGTADFVLNLARLDACALRFHAAPIEARLCASGLLGRLSATGRETRDSPGTVHRPFVATGASASLSLRLQPLLEISLSTAAYANLVRDSFEFAPNVFHRVGDATYSMSVGVVLRSR